MSCYALMNILAAKDLTEGQKSVWQYLVFRANGARVCWPKVDEIALYLNMSRRNVMAATKKLAATERIRISRRYRDTNNYHILDVAGLHDVPDFGLGAAAASEVQKPAPMAPEPMVQKTTPIAPEVQKSAPQPEVQKPAPMAPLGCEIAPSEVQKTAQESVQQESKKEEKEESETLTLTPESEAAPRRGLAPAGKIEPIGFAEFWQAYPRKDDKGHARIAYLRALKGGATPAQILAGVERYPFPQQTKYQPMPTTWLNGERWTSEVDDLDPALKAAGITREMLERDAREKQARQQSMMLSVAGGRS